MIKVRKNPYKVLLDAFGEDAQFRCAVEEMGELIQAICKYKRAQESGDKEKLRIALENLREEIADVSINMEELSYMFGEKEIDEIKKYKLERALKRAEKKNLEEK